MNGELAQLDEDVLDESTGEDQVYEIQIRRTEQVLHLVEKFGDAVLAYINRLSDFLFVASRWVNARARGDVLWQPGQTR